MSALSALVADPHAGDRYYHNPVMFAVLAAAVLAVVLFACYAVRTTRQAHPATSPATGGH